MPDYREDLKKMADGRLTVHTFEVAKWAMKTIEDLERKIEALEHCYDAIEGENKKLDGAPLHAGGHFRHV